MHLLHDQTCGVEELHPEGETVSILAKAGAHLRNSLLSSPRAAWDAYSLPGAGKDSTAHAPGWMRLLGIMLRKRPPIICTKVTSYRHKYCIAKGHQ